MEILSGLIVTVSSVFLMGLGFLIFTHPSRAELFLSMFASSAKAHYTEQLFRFVAGIGFVLYAPDSAWPVAFALLGWALVLSALVLMLLPWRFHHRFGEHVIPLVLKHKRLYGVGSLLLGITILTGVVLPFVS